MDFTKVFILELFSSFIVLFSTVYTTSKILNITEERIIIAFVNGLVPLLSIFISKSLYVTDINPAISFAIMLKWLTLSTNKNYIIIFTIGKIISQFIGALAGALMAFLLNGDFIENTIPQPKDLNFNKLSIFFYRIYIYELYNIVQLIFFWQKFIKI